MKRLWLVPLLIGLLITIIVLSASPRARTEPRAHPRPPIALTACSVAAPSCSSGCVIPVANDAAAKHSQTGQCAASRAGRPCVLMIAEHALPGAPNARASFCNDQRFPHTLRQERNKPKAVPKPQR